MTTHQSLMLAAGVGVLQNISVSSEVVTVRNWAESSSFFATQSISVRQQGKDMTLLLYIHLQKVRTWLLFRLLQGNQRSFLLCFSLGHIDLCWWWSSLLSLWAFQFSVPSMFCSWPLSVFPPPLLWCYFLLHAEVTTASLFLDCVRGDLSYLQQGRVVATKELWQVTPSAAAWVPSCCHPLLEGEKLQNLTLSLVSLWRRLLLQYEICASRCCENSPWSFLRLNISRRFP